VSLPKKIDTKMPIAIKSIPVLRDKAAELFQKRIDDNSKNRA
jgi:hypothetical protein